MSSWLQALCPGIQSATQRLSPALSTAWTTIGLRLVASFAGGPRLVRAVAHSSGILRRTHPFWVARHLLTPQAVVASKTKGQVSVAHLGTSWIGTSGYAYKAWRGPFYPPELPAREHLVFASRQLQSIEINRSFYALLSPAACRAWFAQTPKGFVFALKGSRFITHIKKLRDAEPALANFFASGPLVLAEKLGPIVWQLPAATRFDAERLATFLRLLPRTTRQAVELARGHDARLKHGAHVQAHGQRALRHVLEPRHASFLHPECTALLRESGVALAVTDSPAWPSAEEPTADFMYLRLHGSETLYASAYHERELARWAAHVKAYRRGGMPPDARRVDAGPVPRSARDVYVYFDNDAHAHAPRDARRLMDLVRTQARRTRPQTAEDHHATQAARNSHCG